MALCIIQSARIPPPLRMIPMLYMYMGKYGQFSIKTRLSSLLWTKEAVIHFVLSIIKIQTGLQDKTSTLVLLTMSISGQFRFITRAVFINPSVFTETLLKTKQNPVCKQGYAYSLPSPSRIQPWIEFNWKMSLLISTMAKLGLFSPIFHLTLKNSQPWWWNRKRIRKVVNFWSSLTSHRK